MPLTELEQRLREDIARRADDLLDDLRRHVAIPTGGNNLAALDHTRGLLCERLLALGATIELVPPAPRPPWLYSADRPPTDRASDHAPPNKPSSRDSTSTLSAPPTAICRRLGGRAGHDGSRRILLSGHLDTVHDPRGAFRDLNVAADGKTATGPGCVDMKGGLVIAVAALESIESLGISASWSFILNSDEETGSYWSEPALRFAAREHDLALVLEPALPDGSLVIERPGSGQFMIEVTGRSAHVGRDFAQGFSAVNELARAITRLQPLSDPAQGRILNIGPLQGGIATNVVPDLARAWGNVRYATRVHAAELESAVRAIETAEGAMPRVRAFTSFNRPAKPATDDVLSLAHAARAAAEDLGQPLPFGRTGGVCDGNILQDEGLPTIDTLGVRGGGLHTPQEWIELSSLVERCQLLAVLVSRLSRAT